MQIAQDDQESPNSPNSDLVCTVLDSDPQRDTCLIPLSRGKFALVDWQDCGRVSIHKWSIHASGPGRFYVGCYVGKKHWLLHRFVLGMELADDGRRETTAEPGPDDDGRCAERAE